LDSDAFRGGEFGKDVVILQLNCVIPGLSDFVSVAEARRIARFSIASNLAGFGRKVNVSHSRHQENVAVIGDAGPTKMCMTESVDYVVGIMVTGAPVPACQASVRAKLDHAKRHGGTWESVSVSGGADKWIDVIGWIALSSCLLSSCP